MKASRCSASRRKPLCQRRSSNEKTTERMIVNTTLPMIEMFHPKKNFNTTKTRTKIPRLRSHCALVSPIRSSD